eukprot:CAMPEP_0114598752 /NCGR_PEP_ID=MMETSP0125-20121206/21161_1 /TAXON_ID=485358 ORGANISM="Aristerostoma sp., Strain ATCC 50986" /NCGR_SAMPLE_ID=MMETSP0125 /ASSEMBLY_ACC=CAM_ASM_000245 /LENGTH=79 /DNA_ID=CAMNT_0001804875 /DNA_START=285 /DNA_END=524 /DNA_ORIENTATION=-
MNQNDGGIQKANETDTSKDNITQQIIEAHSNNIKNKKVLQSENNENLQNKSAITENPHILVYEDNDEPGQLAKSSINPT